MTISAHSGARVAPGDRFRMNALSIRQERPIADAASLHHGFVAVTSAARLSDVRAVDWRPGIAGRKYCGQVAIRCVAIKTGGCFAASLNRLCMKAQIIGRVWRGVEKRTGEIWKSLASAVAPLALQRWKGNRCICLWPADRGSLIGSNGLRRRALTTLSCGRFQADYRQRGAE